MKRWLELELNQLPRMQKGCSPNNFAHQSCPCNHLEEKWNEQRKMEEEGKIMIEKNDEGRKKKKEQEIMWGGGGVQMRWREMRRFEPNKNKKTRFQKGLWQELRRKRRAIKSPYPSNSSSLDQINFVKTVPKRERRGNGGNKRNWKEKEENRSFRSSLDTKRNVVSDCVFLVPDIIISFLTNVYVCTINYFWWWTSY